VDEANRFFEQIHGFFPGDYFHDDCLFDPDSIPMVASRKMTGKASAPAGKIATANTFAEEISAQAYKDDDLLQEIDELRAKLHKREQEYQKLKALYAQRRKSDTETDSRISQFEAEHDELIALRNHLLDVY
jgi:aspartyl/asparaginyl beta-hydroxylase (cupin superfamily)